MQIKSANNWRVGLSLCLLILAATGCEEPIKYTVNIVGYSNPKAATAKSYILLPGSSFVGSDDLMFQDFSTYIDRALMSQGFVKAASRNTADIAITFSYVIGEPQEHPYTYQVPEFGQTGIESSTTYGNIQYYGGNTATYSGTTYYQPSYGITGYHTQAGIVTIFPYSLRLVAEDVRGKNTKDVHHNLWAIRIETNCLNGRFREVFPIMIAAACPYLGQGVETAITLEESDKRVKAIQQGNS